MSTAVKPDVSAIQEGLGVKQSSFIDVHAFDKLGSTSEWLISHRAHNLERLALGNALLCVTDWQQAGIGRRGKQWQTLPGNITFSILARLPVPAEKLLGLSLVTGLAVVHTLQTNFDLHALLKWPNDIILNDRKLGGLLTEIMSVEAAAARDASHTVELNVNAVYKRKNTDVVTGIGINSKHDVDVLGMGIGAISLQEAGIDLSQPGRDVLIGKICAKVMAYHERFVQSGWGSFSNDWAERDWLMDKPISIQGENSTEHAVARGVNEQGALLIENAGNLQPLYGGNVSIRPTL